jgi:hypothetical protein
MGCWRSCVRKALEDKVWNEEIEKVEAEQIMKDGIDDE